MTSETTTALFHEAGEAEAEGDFVQALRLTAEAARVAPGDDYARAKLAMILSAMAIAQGRFRKDWNLEAIALDVARDVARLLLTRGRLLLAIAACRAGFDLDAEDPTLIAVLDQVHENLQELSAPFSELVTTGALPAIRLPPRDAGTFLDIEDDRRVYELAVQHACSADFGDEDPGKPIPIPILTNLSHDPFVGLVRRMSLVKLPAGEKIIQQGERDASVYILVKGSVDVTRVAEAKQEHLATLEQGCIFGEMALIRSEPRWATVTSRVPVEMFEITGEQVAHVADEFPEIEAELERVAGERLLLRAFGNSPVFRGLSEREKQDLVRNMTFHIVPEGDVLLEQDAEPTGLYLVVSGEVLVARSEPDGVHEIADLTTGDILGEMALVSERELTTARATAVQETVVFHLDHLVFEDVVAIHPEIRVYLESLSDLRQQELRDVGPQEDASEDATMFLVV